MTTRVAGLRALLVAGLVALVMTTTGCMTTMTGIAPSTVPITANDTYSISGSKVTGKNVSMMVQFFFSIPIFPHDPSDDSLKDALRKSNADALVEVAQDLTMIWVPTLVTPLSFYFYITKTHGTPVRISRGGALEGRSSALPESPPESVSMATPEEHKLVAFALAASVKGDEP
ncbi:MAG: hypothetical protein KF858_08495 [Candidatus Sumerlaeia bacterium]|nr:hypothetical protein [Candidatus Sumerlaeia bacterium]